MATSVPIFTADEWATRLLRLFPGVWSADDARKAGAVLNGAFNALGSQYSFLQTELLYAFDASRIATATDEALDRVANDFYGATKYFPAIVKRVAGESDDSLRARIIAAMFTGGGTRRAISLLLDRLTGTVPRLVEPWYVYDCAALDAASYVDIDTVPNSGRIADDGLRGAMFVESPLPSFGNQGNNPVYGLDDGLAADFGFCIDPQPSWFQGPAELDQLLNSKKTLGIKVFRKYSQQALITYPVGNTIWVQPGATGATVTLFPPMAGEFVVLAQPSWNTQVAWTFINNTEFTLDFSEPAPAIGYVDLLIVPLSVPGFGSGIATAATTSGSQAIPSSLAGANVFLQNEWGANSWINSLSSSVVNFKFSNPPSTIKRFTYAMFSPSQSGKLLIPAGNTGCTIPLPTNFAASYQAFAIASWDAQCWTLKQANSFEILFSDPPSVDSYVYWALFPN